VDNNIEITPEMIQAGFTAWGNEFGFCGPPDVDGEQAVATIFKAMCSASTSLCDAK
jgi:hypothetical protein